VRSREHLDGLGELGVAGHLPVVVPIGPHQIGEDLGVSGIGLRPRGGVAVPVPRRGQGVDRVHAVAHRDQCLHHQATVDLDAHHDVGGVLGLFREHGVQSTDAFDPVGDPSFGQDLAVGVEHAHVVVGLCPVDADEDHCSSFPGAAEPGGGTRRANGSVLSARHPTSRQTPSPTGGGTL
jgi:hypothetical protein